MSALATIQPIHASLYPRGVRLPRDMERVRMPDGEKEELSRIAMSIFADCTNVGVPFQDAILAVYLSGLENGAAVSMDDKT